MVGGNLPLASVSSVLAGVARNREALQLGGVDFSALSICGAIRRYETIDGGLRELEPFFPVVDQGGHVVFFVYDIGAQEPIVTTALTGDFETSRDAQDAVALVYDSSACYLAGKDGSLKRLGVSNYRVSERDSLGKTRKIDPEEIETAEVAAIDVLDVGQSAVMRASLASLAVSFVTQDPPSNMCWAACVACIGNYLRGGSRTAVSVAKGYYGSSNYDRPLTNTLIPAVLATNGVSGYFHGSWPSDSLVSKNIGQGYPLVGIMSVNGNTTDTHAVVVRGYVAMSQIYVMDPEFGFTTAAKFGSSYAYTSAYLGAMLRTSEVVRRL